LFSRAVEQHAKAGPEGASALCFDYYALAKTNLVLGAADQAQNALDQLAAALSKQPGPEFSQLRDHAQELQKKLDDRRRNGRTTH
jgi:hypothetical protein